MKQKQKPKLSPMQHFILVFDRGAGHQIDQIEFGSGAKAARSALAAYEDLEERYRSEGNIDIVLIGSDSIETVKVTHSTYFDNEGRSSIEDLLQLVS